MATEILSKFGHWDLVCELIATASSKCRARRRDYYGQRDAGLVLCFGRHRCIRRWLDMSVEHKEGWPLLRCQAHDHFIAHKSDMPIGRLNPQGYP